MMSYWPVNIPLRYVSDIISINKGKTKPTSRKSLSLCVGMSNYLFDFSIKGACCY